MIVVDTNILAHTWLPSEEKPKILELLEIDHEWVAPILWRSEMRSVLAKFLRKGLLTEAQANEIASTAEDHMTGREFQVPTRAVLSLLLSSKLSSYDCEFVALARMQDVPLVTFERRIPKEFPDQAWHIDDFLKRGRRP